MPALRTLISVAELQQQTRISEQLVVVDCRADLMRPAAGHEMFLAGHLPDAQFADLNTLLSGPIQPGRTGRHPLPDVSLFIAQAAALGIGDNIDVVCYDAASGAFAARLWWLLRMVGHADVAILDGGFAAWQNAGGELQSGAAGSPRRAQLSQRASLTRVVSAANLNLARVLLDARDPPRYRGEVEPIDAKAGHIPGAINAPFMDNLSANGLFKGQAALHARFAAFAAAPTTISDRAKDATTDIAVYCGSGVTACHNILAMVHAGFDEPALYPGSFSEWITDPTHEVALGPKP